MRRRRVRRAGAIELTGRQWTAASLFAAASVWVAVGVGPPPAPPGRVDPGRVHAALDALGGLRTVAARPAHDDRYSRDAFGAPWTDATRASGAGDGCDTRIIYSHQSGLARFALVTVPALRHAMQPTERGTIGTSVEVVL